MVFKIVISFAFIVTATIAADCEVGYYSGWFGCSDIDECSNSTICVSGQCVNTPGSYQCVNGSDSVSITENDLKFESETETETQTQTGAITEETTTIATPNSGCKPGFSRDWWGRCIDIDECTENKHNCSQSQTCENTEGSFECKCADGEESCVSVDSCASNPCNQQTSICRVSNKSYECDCKNGFVKNDDEECEDVNECDLYKFCSHDCRNTEGSFHCLCPPGYELHENHVNCTDLNECEQSSPCEQGCRNTLGSFVCYCNAGYRLVDGNRCLPERESVAGQSSQMNRFGKSFNEIERETEEESHVLFGPHSSRMNDKCQFGYYFNRRTQRCEDIDECKLQLHNCERNEDCLNNIGSFVCIQCETGNVRNADGSCEKPRCYPGYVYDEEKQKCVDFDECIHISPCGREPCYNVEGAYFCGCYGSHCPEGEYRKGCIPGFEPSRFSIKHCVDVNECLDRSLNNCNRDEVCVNTFGGFFCQCKLGFKRDQLRRCTDIDECKLFPGICYGTCLNSEGSFHCVGSTADRQQEKKCDGYVDSNGQCIESTDACTSDGGCKYQDGCQRGFKMSSQGLCVDIDECEEDVCGDEERCENTEGGYRCVENMRCEGTNCIVDDRCDVGFHKDSFGKCVDIDECIDNNICGEQRCENIEGSYRCVDIIGDDEETDCEPGYAEDSYGRCVDIDECKQSNICGEKKCENTKGSYRCMDKKHDSGSCSQGFFYDKLLKKCVDIDECQIEIDNCMEFTCENTIGSFVCHEQKCYPGYESINGICYDINECERLGNAACSVNETCHNSKGAYYCQKCGDSMEYTRCYARKQCMPGYEPTKLPHFSCTDVDECKAGFHRCSKEEQCVNTIPGYRCDCKQGYTRNRKNECVIDHSSCGIDNYCPDLTQPNPCPQGFEVSRDGLKCDDIDECLSNPCRSNEECHNYRGRYRCYVKEM